jgi:benzoate-CoA ligase family protein
VTAAAVPNATVAFLDAAVEEGRGARRALATPAGAASYAELLALVERAAAGLRSRGVKTGDRVALLLPDGLAWAAAFFGTLRAGAVAIPLNTRLAAPALATLLADSGAAVLVADPELAGPAREAAARSGLSTVLDPETLLAPPGRRFEPVPVGPDAMAFWIYTSGTTGTPKAAVHLHRNLLACRHYGGEVLGAGAEDRVFVTSKLFFAYALGNALLVPLFARAESYLHPGWADAATVGAVARAYRPTLFFSVPTMYARLLDADLPADTFACARACVSAGERLPTEVYRAWRARFGVEILDGIGATETIFMMLSSRLGRSRAGSTGMPVPGTEARLLDVDGAPVAGGAQGVLWVRTPSLARGYWQRPEATGRAFDGEWFRTGDVYYVDADGHWIHCGRQDDLFKVAGQWVVPADVEAVALRHPAVLEAGLVGAEEESGLVKPYLFVVPREARADAAALVAELRERLAREAPAHARPREILVVPELPRTDTGKLQRYRLRDRLAAPHPEEGGCRP